jgi:hypothetical protein
MVNKIFIDSGGWYISYYMGLLHYIFTNYGIDKFKKIYFEGVSAGGQACPYALATIYGNHNMKYWLKKGPKKVVYDDQYGCGKLTKGFYNSGKLFYSKLNKTQKSKIKKYFSAICSDIYNNPYICNNINSSTEFASTVASTGNIPIIGCLLPQKYKDKYLWDGNLNTNYYNNLDYNSNNILFITFSPLSSCNNSKIIQLDLSKWIHTSLFTSLIPSFLNPEETLQYIDILFKFGYNNAKKHKDILFSKLDIFFSKC